jgi:3-oxoacyl-[acyl-carrier protein] reductase
MASNRLAGKVALVTGGGRGIGRSLCLQLAAEGARVVVNDLDPEPAEAVANEIAAAGGESLAVAGNVAGAGFAEAFVAGAIERFGDAHIVVNNAGYIWNSPLHRMTDEQWDAMQDVHLKAPFRVLRAFHAAIAPRIAAENAADLHVHRKVVNVSSLSATSGAAGQANYSAAKAGLFGLTRSLAKEWGRLRINVNCVAFGLIETRLTQEIAGETAVTIEGERRRVGLTAAMLAALRDDIPLGRAGRPDEAAGGVLLLCLPEADYITGQILRIDGGLAG